MLDQQYQLEPDKRTMDADSLSKVIDNEERLLIASVKELGDYTKNLSIKWDDIKTKLTNKDLAVEFACIIISNAIQQNLEAVRQVSARS